MKTVCGSCMGERRKPSQEMGEPLYTMPPLCCVSQPHHLAYPVPLQKAQRKKALLPGAAGSLWMRLLAPSYLTLIKKEFCNKISWQWFSEDLLSFEEL